MFGVPAARMNVAEAPALGAAVLAGVGAGIYASVPEACGHVVLPRDRVMPDPDAGAVYARHYPLYRALYEALREPYRTLAALS